MRAQVQKIHITKCKEKKNSKGRAYLLIYAYDVRGENFVFIDYNAKHKDRYVPGRANVEFELNVDNGVKMIIKNIKYINKPGE